MSAVSQMTREQRWPGVQVAEGKTHIGHNVVLRWLKPLHADRNSAHTLRQRTAAECLIAQQCGVMSWGH